jgi:hypothetical protein
MTRGWVNKVRLMRRDATLAFLREMFEAPILSSEWTVVCDEDRYEDAVESIEASTLPFKEKFLEDACRGLFDFGWQPYEVIKEQHSDGTFYVENYKSLLQDMTTICVDYNGALVGLRNQSAYGFVNTNPVFLFRGDFVCLYRQAEGTNWYGEAIMRRAERPYDSWNESDDAARRFDNKVAGATWVVYYPSGTSDYNGVKDMDNSLIAKDILDKLQSSGKIAIPQTVLRSIDDMVNSGAGPDKAAWRVELVSAQTQQSVFVDRGRYLDSLKSRAVGIPERASLEGQFGTKAEAEAHADFAINNIERFHRNIVSLLNKQSVNVLLELNNGPGYKDKVRLQSAPLSDSKKAFLKQLYMSHIATEAGQAEETEVTDFSAIRESLGVPIRNQGQRLSRRQQYLQQQRRLTVDDQQSNTGGVGDAGQRDAGGGPDGAAGLDLSYFD